MRKRVYHPTIRDGKHTEAKPALPSTYAIPGLGHASVTGAKAWQFADWGQVTRSVNPYRMTTIFVYRRGIPKTAVSKDEGVIYIPKANGKKRPLGIPVMRDRAMQALHLLGLEPISETSADPNSYGFRLFRSCHDAIARCFSLLAKKNSPQWIMEGDIKGCFDHISHDWMLENIPLEQNKKTVNDLEV